MQGLCDELEVAYLKKDPVPDLVEKLVKRMRPDFKPRSRRSKFRRSSRCSPRSRSRWAARRRSWSIASSRLLAAQAAREVVVGPLFGM